MNQFFQRLYINRSPTPRNGESPTPRINKTGSRYLKKKISLASIFRTLSSRVGEYFVHAVGFYLSLAIFATWKSFQHGLINYIDTKAK